MQNGKSYVRDSGHFQEKIKNISTLLDGKQHWLGTTAEWVCTPEVVFIIKLALSALKKALENRSVKKIPTEILIKMAEFALKNNLFDEFNNKVFQQISGTASYRY